jgi:hypothetical protein
MIAFIVGVSTLFAATPLPSEAFVAVLRVVAALRGATTARCGRADLPVERRPALEAAFFTDLRADFVDFFRAPAAVLAERPAAFTDALLMGR